VADPIGLRAAVTNLITNAIQYNVPDGTVAVTVETSSSSPGLLTLAVTDSGVGLAPHDAERVFDRFYRADRSRDHSTGGAGLGLAIVAAFARAHGGSASVESTPGAGSTFTLTLPTQRS
jgi:signal transduction histidine kinase